MLTKKEWKDLAKIALIGTDRVTPSVSTLEKLEELGVNRQDTTEAVLQGAGVMALLRKGGFELPSFEGLIPDACEPEAQGYISPKSAAHLKEILSTGLRTEREGYAPALNEFLFFTYKNDKIILPELLPAVFQAAQNDNPAAKLLPFVVGKRGLWLGMTNGDWALLLNENSQEVVPEPKLTKEQTLSQAKELVEKIKNTAFVWSEDKKLIAELKALSYQADFTLAENLDFIFSNNLSYTYQNRITDFLKVLIFRSKMVEELNNRNH